MIERYHLHYPLQSKDFQASPQVLAMGFFDGVHRGHQAVIAAAKAAADERGLPLAVLTYEPYPGLVFEKTPLPFHYLTPLAEKTALLAELGVDRVYCLQLTAHLAALSPQEFIAAVLQPLAAEVVVAGFDHRYGPAEQDADMAHLKDYAAGAFDVITVDKQSLANESAKIASRTIRHELQAGDLAAVNQALGRIHQTKGLVVRGDARGRTLGFPTINLATPEDYFLPGLGIYAVQVDCNGQRYQGMASIGRNITFEANRPVTVEINLFDFDDQVYGEEVTVYWYAKLRDEVKYQGAAALVAQLEKDRAQTQAYFAEKTDS
ncbi:riboflavin biosynthesis protein RibF [Leuconostocaceae bacterium ESL0958]|nr:riboflavin biosynthesis protein RibF [Leuconostocaceae bacterium ESL0958]